MTDLARRLAPRFARIALGHVERQYPHVHVQVIGGPKDLAAHRALHPVFFGSFDWHSAVHGHWLLARLLRLAPDMDEAAAIRARFDAAFTPDAVAAERAFFARPINLAFERPYGWAWLLTLAAELRRQGEAAAAWEAALRPFAEDIAALMRAFLPKADYPVRAGVHSNTAFALALAHGYALEAGDAELEALIRAKALAFFGADWACQAWEPSGDDFLSPALIEAELMRRVMAPEAFRAWFAAFLPDLAGGRPASLFAPARVSDRGDGKIAHLDGLNLSRAWCWRSLSRVLGAKTLAGQLAERAAERHLEASLGAVSGDYFGEHWLASFALLALLA